MKKIHLWSGPRNISTAIMYSLAQRMDTKVVDEPLYGYYLKHSKRKKVHPIANKIVSHMECDGQKLLRYFRRDFDKPFVFFKQMSHHLLTLDKCFLLEGYNVILTRHPKDMILSFSKVVKSPNIDDLGYLKHLEILDYLNVHGQPPIVLDSKRLLLDPKKVLRILCDKLEMPFLESMLSWEKGPIEEDGIWAKYWYKSVHNSTGFNKYVKTNPVLPADQLPLLDQCLPIYHKLMSLSI